MRKRKNLYTHFFLSLTTIAVCSVLVLAVAIFFWYRNITINNVNKANQSVLLNTETVFMNYKEIVQNYTMDFYANPNINALMMSGDNGWSDQLYSALSQIRGALVVNQYLENAYIFGIDKPVAMFENMPLSPASKEELFRRVRDSRIVESPFLWHAKQNNGTPVTLMTVFYNDRAFDSSGYYGAVAITVNLSKLQNNLFSQEDSDSTHYKVLDAGGAVLMHSPGGGALETDLLEQIVAPGKEQGSFVLKGSGEPQLITYVHSAKDNLWFLSETPYQDSIRDISSARNLMIALCLALTVAAAATAYLISRRIYQPIGRIFGNIANISGNENALKGGDYNTVSQELESIGERLAQLRKENSDSALMRWLLAPRGSSGHSGEPVQLPVAGGSYCVCVLSMHAGEPGGDLQAACEELLGRIDLAFAEWAEIRTFRPHQHTAVLIVSELNPGCLGDYALFCSHWEKLELASSASSLQYALGISTLTDDSALLKQKYDEAAECQRYVKFHQHRQVIFADDIIHLNSSPVQASTMEPVLQAVRLQHQSDHIRQAVERLLAVACSYRAEPAAVLVAKLALELSRTAEVKADMRDFGFLDYYQHIERIKSYTELRSWLESCCYAARERLVHMDTVQTRSLAGEAIHYISQHYNDPKLSLNALAEKLAISPAYLSRLIADETGSSFPDLVNLQRLEQAQTLLVTELALDIREIAEQVGYNSSTYFTTQFKKRYGVTPSKWRMNHILQQQE
ncbi:AraC family transcriptional regulator ['Paenibacillus yunnanensis' Narsing Rao et al. 2020]|uniref:AraC family transcriptional regulator n=1 Tax=Paenibacillus tengchongensis TaxID=2608684 RepID=UPI00124D73F4|nr:helix-turn-helix domain-containing protein [Paenibacillus tengchongensis]